MPQVEAADAVAARLSELAVRAIEAIGGRFMSVDLIHTPDDVKVIEINSGVMLDRFAAMNAENQALAVRIYRDAIVGCFA